MTKTKAWAAAMAAIAVAASPALAQKSQDTLRVAFNNPFPTASTYHYGLDEAGVFTNGVFETLIGVDERQQKMVPILATSWQRIDDKTLEFDLRQGVSFHNGNAFDADDVIALTEKLIDPKTKLRFIERYNWVAKIEKLGPYKVRFTSRRPLAVDLQRIAYGWRIWDGETLARHADWADYGRLTPVGTGPYKVAELEANRGITIERHEAYSTNKEYARAPIRRLKGVPMPDRNTQIAELVTGGIDLIRNITPDQAALLKEKPNLRVTALPSANLTYFAMDSINKSGNSKPLSDVRVRRAIAMAIDRDSIIKHIVPGGEAVGYKLPAMCFPTTTACKWSVKLPDYDPQQAKKLLAEAGYPEGFDLQYDVYAPIKDIGVAIAGELLKVGIRVTVTPQPLEVWRRRQAQNELSAWSVLYPTGIFPDASNILDAFYVGVRDYFNDPIIDKAIKDGDSEFDVAKRAAIYQKAFNRSNEMVYIFPMSSIPNVYGHTAEVRIERHLMSASEIYASEYFWN